MIGGGRKGIAGINEKFLAREKKKRNGARWAKRGEEKNVVAVLSVYGFFECWRQTTSSRLWLRTLMSSSIVFFFFFSNGRKTSSAL
jgi:hypothetical protein